MTSVITQEQGFPGLALKIPRIVTSATLSQVTTAGFYNNNPIFGEVALNPQDLVAICYSYGNPSLQSTALFSVKISNGIVTLSLAESNVVLPVVSGHFTNFSGTSGSIADLGYLPSNAAKTVVSMVGSTVIANHIACYTDTSGTTDDDAATAINAGNIQAGLSGVAGVLSSFPASSANGSLIVAAVNAGAAHNTTISNSTMGQASVVSIPDPGTATANFAVAPAALVSGNLVKASGVAGLIADQGFAMKSVAQAAVAGGAAAQTITDAFCTTGSMVLANWNDTSNAVEIKTVAAGNGSFVVTSTGDPGASHISYIITK